MKQIKLTQGYEAIVDDCDYERVSQFKWRAFVNRSRYTTIVYAVRTVFRNDKRTTEYLHRFLLHLTNSKVEVDHINGDGLDNRRCNIRLASSRQNKMNTRKRQCSSTSIYKGVHWSSVKDKWQARIRIDGKKTHLGFFADEEEAARAYNIAALNHHGEYARINNYLN